MKIKIKKEDMVWFMTFIFITTGSILYNYINEGIGLAIIAWGIILGVKWMSM